MYCKVKKSKLIYGNDREFFIETNGIYPDHIFVTDVKIGKRKAILTKHKDKMNCFYQITDNNLLISANNAGAFWRDAKYYAKKKGSDAFLGALAEILYDNVKEDNIF